MNENTIIELVDNAWDDIKEKVETAKEWVGEGYSLSISGEILEEEPGCERPIPFDITVKPNGETETLYDVQ